MSEDISQETQYQLGRFKARIDALPEPERVEVLRALSVWALESLEEIDPRHFKVGLNSED